MRRSAVNVELTKEELSRLQQALANIRVHGERYAASHQRFINR
jgi:hypothetical protein